MNFICTKVEQKYFFTFKDYAAAQQTFTGRGIVGIALPMESGQFRVARFDLTGAAEASVEAKRLVLERNQKGIKD